MGLRLIDTLAILLLNLVKCAYMDHILSCNITSMEPCPGKNQICIEKSGECVCLKGFIRVGDECEEPNDDFHASHGTTVAVVTIFTLALVICGLVLAVRKYNLVEYVRQKINLRRTNDVTYEDVMIGNDDPPLSL